MFPHALDRQFRVLVEGLINNSFLSIFIPSVPFQAHRQYETYCHHVQTRRSSRSQRSTCRDPCSGFLRSLFPRTEGCLPALVSIRRAPSEKSQRGNKQRIRDGVRIFPHTSLLSPTLLVRACLFSTLLRTSLPTQQWHLA